LDLTGLPLDQALNDLLDHVGGAYVRLGYSFDEDGVCITTAQELAKLVSTRVYDVRGAIKEGPSRADSVAAILRRVRGIDPLSWKEAGGEVGSVRELSRQLIVTQTPENQKLIAEELRDARTASQAQ
jgi:hypothetical protein